MKIFKKISSRTYKFLMALRNQEISEVSKIGLTANKVNPKSVDREI